MAAELRDEKLDFWIKHKLNALFIGKHGVGKTARILEAFRRANLNFMYFSGSTMDPWVDFVGVPRAVKDEKGEYLEFVRPKGLRDDLVQAIFIDEYNRSHKKIRNAVMELIQLKSINGRKFENLDIVWAAVNPDDGEDETYQVEPMDPAQEDRFQVHVIVPYKPCVDYFKKTYGPELARSAVAWWNGLPDVAKKKISPRRLDYALKMYNLKGDLADVLPKECSISELLSTLRSGPMADKLKHLFDTKNGDEARKFLADENNYASAQRYFFDDVPVAAAKRNDWVTFFVPLLSTEKLSSMLASNDKVCDFILDNFSSVPIFRDVARSVFHAGQCDKRLRMKIQKKVTLPLLQLPTATVAGTSGAKPVFVKGKNAQQCNWRREIDAFKKESLETTPRRKKLYNDIAALMPETFIDAIEVLETLELLQLACTRCWDGILRKEYGQLTGLMNHLFSELARITGKNWATITKMWGDKFNKLIEKVNLAGMGSELAFPNLNPPAVKV